MLRPLSKVGARPQTLWLSILAATVLTANAQEPEDLGILDEILVTAQKRVESLQDVPISANVVTGDTLTRIDINNFEEMQFTVPNFNLTRTVLSTQAYMRGIGSGNSPAIEQSVGTYIDGVYYGRQRQLRTPFFDLDRIEVLRGPHNTLLGKNTIAGALNITTNGPSDSFEGEVALTSGEYGQNDVQAIVSGPLTDNLRGRLVGRFYENDGYLENLSQAGNPLSQNPDQSEQQEREYAVRGIIEWDINYDAKLTLKAEYGELEADGGDTEVILDQANGIIGPTFYQVVSGGSGGLVLPFEEAELDRKRYSNDKTAERTKTFGYVATFEYELSPFTFTSVSGYTGYETPFEDGACDCDFTNVTVVNARGSQDYSQISQELRLTSPVGNTVEWIGGIFYQQNDLEIIDFTDIPIGSLLTVPPNGTPQLAGTSASRDFETDSELYAGFAQLTWNISDDFRATVGVRESHETKTSSKSIDIVNIADNSIVTDLVALGAWTTPTSAGGLGVEHNQNILFPDPLPNDGYNIVDEERDESSTTLSANVQWDAWDNGLLYVSYSEGFKAGGFDVRSNTIAQFEFEDERSESYEVGSKMSLWDGRVEFNTAIYHSKFNNLQVSQADGGLGFNVGNAEDTVVQGIEIDGRLALSRDLTARYSFAYLDFEFENFTQAECYVNQNGTARSCDISGQEYGFTTPDYTAYLALDYVTAVSTEVDFAFSVSAYHSDNYNAHVTYDPVGERPAYTWLDLRMGVETESWELALLGKNLTDEEVVTYSGNVPLSNVVTAGAMPGPLADNPAFASSTIYAIVAPPATWSVQGKWKF